MKWTNIIFKIYKKILMKGGKGNEELPNVENPENQRDYFLLFVLILTTSGWAFARASTFLAARNSLVKLLTSVLRAMIFWFCLDIACFMISTWMDFLFFSSSVFASSFSRSPIFDFWSHSRPSCVRPWHLAPLFEVELSIIV